MTCGGAIIVFSLSILLSGCTPIPWVIIAVGTLLAFTIFYVGWEREYLIRPKCVEVLEDGIIIHMRYGQGKKHVRYEQIKWLSVSGSDQSKLHRFGDPDGYIGLGNKMKDIHPIVHPLAMQIRDAYGRKLGRWPPHQNPDWAIKK